MKTSTREQTVFPAVAAIAALLLALPGCGGDKESTGGDAAAGGSSGQAASASAGNSSAGPDTSGLAEIILGKINADPTRQELKVTGKLLEFSVISANSETFGDVANTVVECAGVVVFDGDVQWNWQDTEPKKAGEPAKFECSVEYVNQGNGWEIFGPMGIYPT